MDGIYNFGTNASTPDHLSIVGLFAMKDKRFQECLKILDKYPSRVCGQLLPQEHLLETSIYVSMLGGEDDDRLIALLHDSIDDKVLTYEQIKAKFGAVVADAVKELSNPRISILSKQASRVNLSSKLSNVRSVELKKPEGWSEDKKVEYIKSCRKLFDDLSPEFVIPSVILTTIKENTDKYL